MSKITIPPEALEAAYATVEKGGTLEAACLAMIESWPKMKIANNGSSIVLEPHIILPLTENQNDKG